MRRMFAVLAAAAVMMLTLPALGQKGDKPGHGGPPDKAFTGPGKAQGPGQGHKIGPQATPQGGPPSGAARGTVVVPGHDRNTIYGYYRTQYLAGNCPPGLAKKGNGCLPPGQAKKVWVIGQPLPAGAIYYPLPGVLLGQLGPPPVGYEYIRVANDILLMAVGTRMIAGAVADLSSF